MPNQPPSPDKTSLLPQTEPNPNTTVTTMMEASSTIMAPLYPLNRVFTKGQLEVLILDIDRRRMRWANEVAIELWNASSSLQELQDRNFGQDMSDATITRLATYQAKFRLGQRISDCICWEVEFDFR